MPNLSNCPHQAEGWCLACVQEKIKQPKRETPSGYISAEDVAQLLKISMRCVRNYQKRRILPHYKFGHFVYFKREEIIAAIEATKVEARAKP